MCVCVCVCVRDEAYTCRNKGDLTCILRSGGQAMPSLPEARWALTAEAALPFVSAESQCQAHLPSAPPHAVHPSPAHRLAYGLNAAWRRPLPLRRRGLRSSTQTWAAPGAEQHWVRAADDLTATLQRTAAPPSPLSPPRLTRLMRAPPLYPRQGLLPQEPQRHQGPKGKSCGHGAWGVWRGVGGAGVAKQWGSAAAGLTRRVGWIHVPVLLSHAGAGRQACLIPEELWLQSSSSRAGSAAKRGWPVLGRL